jgi:hypothetical protein
MKKPAVLALCLLLLLAVVPAASALKDPFKSKPSRFAAVVLQSLYKFEEARLQMVVSTDDTQPASAAGTLLRALDNYRQATVLLKPYLNDPDSMIKSIAGLLSDEIEVFIRDGNRVADMMRRYVADPSSVNEEESYTWAQEAEKREVAAYHIMGGVVATFLPKVVADTSGQKGKIAYKISKHERAMLLFRIDLLFEKQLKEYAADPAKSHEMIAGIAILQKKLETETYEQLAGVRNPFPDPATQ